ncbi:MAG TPA: methylenetetrahydrofolate--tRNA-(uracil(54)-C(5))-methyltransferase (FADH(2)-oxidizing) TrmFO, partial [Armatimonadota bacterium]|nr:methylenetetrahydrofolate--tRNA-(uracil(54)-C(5))-methyltransferase (FADH(2)-oxidizing) TrmFO [Armatimonadota bacterium]
MLGSLISYITTAPIKQFQPMNANFGIFPPLDVPEKKDEIKRAKMVERALAALDEWQKEL